MKTKKKLKIAKELGMKSVSITSIAKIDKIKSKKKTVYKF